MSSKKRKRTSKSSSKKRKRTNDRDKTPKKKRRIETKKSEDWMDKCLNLLKKLMKLPLAVEFNQPVDWEYWKLWDYPKIVEHPMDLESVKTFLENGEFLNMEHFSDNVRLTFLNAMKFHPEGSGIYNAAKSLLFFFDQKFAEIDAWMKTGEKPKPVDFLNIDLGSPTELDPDIVQAKNEIKKLMNESKSKTKSIEHIKNIMERAHDREIALLPPTTPFTFEERDDLCTKMTLLTQEDITGLIDIVNPDEAPEDEEWELDLEAMDDYTFAKVKKYVQECILKNGYTLNTEDVLQRTENEANERIQFLQRQLKGVSLSKDLHIGMYVAVNPSKDQESHDVFWIGKISALPADANVKVQWFELEEVINENERYYRLSNKVDEISVLSIFFSVSLNLTLGETEKRLYKLVDFKRTTEECNNYSIDYD